MNITRRRGAIAFSITLGVLLVGGLIAFNIAWIILNERRIVLLVLGIIVSALLTAGVVLNTVFLVRELRRNERQDSFLNAVTHELKTPIASIRLYLETLQRRELPEEQRQHFYSIMLADSDRLLGTVEQVLRAGQISARQRHQSRTVVVLPALVSECIGITLQRHHLGAEAIALEPVPAGVRLNVLGIADDLRAAVLNLLDNAVKYSPGGVEVRCRLEIVDYSNVALTVCDSGLGIPQQQLKRVFKRFYRVPGRNAVRVKGTGLGLFLVRTIARQHGGNVVATSPGPNRGSTFTLTLPLATVTAARIPSRMTAMDEAAPLIALVEDEEHLAQGLLFNLQAEGYRTHHEADGDTALAWLLATPQSGSGRVAAVVLDCMLPGKDGFEIVRAMRAAERYTPVLMLTARARPEDVLEGIEAGADDYLPKPFELNILLVRIKSLLRRTAWQAAAAAPAAGTGDSPERYSFGGRTIRFDALELVSPRGTTHLTLMEADLLRFLTERAGQIVPRKDILEQVWRVHEDTDTRAIDNFIVRLRRYIEEDPASPVYLTTVRGVGYRFVPNP